MRSAAVLVLLSSAALATAQTFTVSTGVMLEARGLDESTLQRRSDVSSPLIQRALGSQKGELHFDERGNIVYPESPVAAFAERSVVSHRHARRGKNCANKKGKSTTKSSSSYHKSSSSSGSSKTHEAATKTHESSTKTKSSESSSSTDDSITKKITSTVDSIVSSFAATITWYTGQDLKNPSCLSSGGWNPTDNSKVAALTINWPGKPKCGDFLKLTAGGKSTTVRVMDSCAGCASGSKHVDLTKSAFEELYAESVGLVDDVKCEVLKNPPSDHEDESLYGPVDL